MKKNLKDIGYILMFVILSSVCVSCNDDDISSGAISKENIVGSMLDDACFDWNASKDDVQAKMDDYVLVDSDADFLHYTDPNRVIKLSYSFVDDCLQATVAIAPKSIDAVFASYLKGYESLGELSSKEVRYNTSKNTMCFSYGITSDDVEYSVVGFAPIVSDLYDGDIVIKVDYKNLIYKIDDKPFKMILVDGGDLPAFYMMQTEVPLSGEFKIGETTIGKIDSNADNCIIKAELRSFINKLNDATGLNFRLPTEKEWKYAAKGGVKSNNYTYSGGDNIDDVAWYRDNCSGIQDVALKLPNELGFYDMSGNYSEVCSDSPLDIDGRTYGGCWKYAASQCTPTSYKSGNTSTDKITGTSIVERNAVDGRYISVRLVYSSPE